MSGKTEILEDILSSLSDNDTELLDKIATDANGLTNTENPEARKKVPSQTPTKTEGKLGLSILSKNKHEDTIRRYDGVQANKKDGLGTENISVKKPPAEPGVVFEKRASDEIAKIYEDAGIDLSKVASDNSKDDLLLKVAEDTLSEINDLEKVAEILAEHTAEIFIKKVEESLG